MYEVKVLIVFLTLTAAVWTDIKKGRISNKLLLFTLIAGFAISAMGGIAQLQDSFFGMTIPFLIFFAFYLLRMLGAGDIKLFCALGAVMGKDWILNCVVLSILSGGVIALGIMLYRRRFKERMVYIYSYIYSAFLTRKIGKYQNFSDSNEATFPFAIGIAAGGLLAFVFAK